MSGICDTCRRKPCPAEGEGLRYCDFYEGGETRWERLFGTPERAARTITRMQMATDLMGCCDADLCPAAFNECWKLDTCPMDDYDALLEWLRGDA